MRYNGREEREGEKAMERGLYRKASELAAWDLNAGCRWIVNQSTESNRRLNKKIRKIDRKRLDKIVKEWYN